MLRNSAQHYGLVHISLHWLLAAVIFGLFGLGLWMVGLDYYHRWYHSAPDLHRSIGVLVVFFTLLRLLWRQLNPGVLPLPSHARWERNVAHISQVLMYLLIFLLGVSGYLISTAQGQPVKVFDWLIIPAVNLDIPYQEDVAGDWHEIFAWSLISLVVLHLLGALKHHFMDKDMTLRRMLLRGKT
jgi:cytochrome b561